MIVVIVVVVIAANAVIAVLIALLISLETIAVPVVRVRIHWAITLGGVHAVLVSSLIGALTLRILGILAVPLAASATLLYPA